MTDIGELVTIWSGTKGTDQIFDLFSDALSDHGYDRIAYFSLPSSSTEEDVAFESTYPEAWTTHYLRQEYRDIDPVADYLVGARTPFTWAALENNFVIGKRQRQILSEAREAGLHDGITIPLHGPYGEISTVCMARNNPGEMDAHVLQTCGLLSQHFHSVYSSQSCQNEETLRPELTYREREVLMWCVKAKSNWAIGEILNISEHSVKFHMQNVYAKLGANSRISAVVKAIRMGLLRP